MSTELTLFNAGAEVPAHILATFGEESNIGPRQTINMLTYKGKTWRTVIDGEEKKLMRKDPETGDTVAMQIINLVVLDHNKARSRAFYEGDFVDGEAKAPRCSSSDGVRPDADVKEPPASTCATCPNAVKGSKITDNGKQSTLCVPNKRIAVVPAGRMISQHPIMLLRIAQTSIWDKDNAANEQQGWYAWDQYIDMLRARGVKHTAAVETRVKFDVDKPYPKLLFSASKWLDEKDTLAVRAVLADKTDDIGKILSRNAGAQDGVAGQPGIPADGIDPDDNAAAKAAAAEAAKKAAEAEAAKKAAEAEAAKKAAAAQKKAAAAEAAKKAEEEAKKAAEAAAAASAGDEDDAWGAEPDTPPAATTAPAATAATTATGDTTVEATTPAALNDLLNGWDD